MCTNACSLLKGVETGDSRKYVYQPKVLKICFYIYHFLFTGTGSGVGTFILNLLEEEYPDVYR